MISFRIAIVIWYF